MKIRKWIRPTLFTLGGALAGLAYYYFIGCASGNCPITSSLFGSMLYMGLIGWLISGIFSKECGSCQIKSHIMYEDPIQRLNIVVLKKWTENYPV